MLERYVVLDDGETFGGPNIVVDVDISKLTDEERESYESCIIEDVVAAVENSKGAAGRILSINALVDLFDAIDVCGDGLPPALWEAYNQCLIQPLKSGPSDSDRPTDS